MMDITPYRLERAVTAICPDIAARVEVHRVEPSERRLWWELSCCVLSSQVPYQLAVAAADRIQRHDLLLNDTCDTTALAGCIARTLGEPIRIEGRARRYRFPESRARHLAATRVAVTQIAGTLQCLLADLGDASEARSWFVRNAPGLGPKQASMFLRNSGISYELAILDRHVLDYMSTLGLYNGTRRFLPGLSQYRRQEAVLKSYAADVEAPVGLLDWAIWIVMRVARASFSRGATS